MTVAGTSLARFIRMQNRFPSARIRSNINSRYEAVDSLTFRVCLYIQFLGGPDTSKEQASGRA
jgi:hypothetical protein